MERDFQRSASVRAIRRQERNNLQDRAKDAEGGFFSPGRLPQDYPMKIIWKRVLFVWFLWGPSISWMLLILLVQLFHVWYCQYSVAFFSGKGPSQPAPKFIGNLIAFVLNLIGPKGLEFARYSLDYHTIRNYLYTYRTWGEQRASRHMPSYAKKIVSMYNKNGEIDQMLSRK